MEMPDEPAMATLEEERTNAGVDSTAALRQRLALRRRKKIRPLAKPEISAGPA